MINYKPVIVISFCVITLACGNQNARCATNVEIKILNDILPQLVDTTSYHYEPDVQTGIHDTVPIDFVIGVYHKMENIFKWAENITEETRLLENSVSADRVLAYQQLYKSKRSDTLPKTTC